MDAATRRQRGFVFDPPSGRRDAIRYGLAMIVVGIVFAPLLFALGSVKPDEEASQVSDAVMVDLPPAEAAGRPGDEGLDDREQLAAAASVGQVAPPTQKSPKPQEPPKLDDPPKPAEQPADLPPPPPAVDPAAVLEREQKTQPPRQLATAPPQAAQEAVTRSGSAAKSDSREDRSEDDVARRSAHAFSSWQKAMIASLEKARHSAARVFRGAGTAKVAFSIDRRGRLVSERVVHSSGDSALDGAALTLVKRAAPFPAPPAGAKEKDMSFVVPIRFRRM